MQVSSRHWSAALFVCIAVVGCSSGTVQIPTSYTLYNAKDGTFECDAPEGWEIKGGGKSSGTPVWANFASGPALIQIKANSTGALANAGLSPGVSDPSAPPDWEPVHLIHVADIKNVEEEYDGYTEIAGSPVVMNCRLGPARLSEFTYTASFGTSMHGY